MRSLKVEINTVTVDYYDETGEYMDGDRREISGLSTDVIVLDADDFDMHGTPTAAAAHYIGRTDATETSAYPLEDAVSEHVWLCGSYSDPMTGYVLETSVYLTGEWTDAERSDVFRAVAVSR